MTREEALKLLADARYADDLQGNDDLQTAHIMAMKALEQEPKVGHWEYVQYDYNPKLGNWHCSECRCIAVECISKEDDGGIPLYE